MSAAALPPACILAGGRGTRLGTITDGLPKPMVQVAGRPFIDWLLDQMRAQGFTEIVLLVGYRGDAIRAHIGDGSAFGLSVEYSDDGLSPVGTLGAIRQALSLLGEDVPVLYGDTYLAAPFRDIVEAHQAGSAAATMTVLHNRGAGDASNAVVANGMVAAYCKQPPPPGAEWIDYGFSVLGRDLVEASTQSDLAALMEVATRAGLVRAWPATEMFHDIGTPEALRKTEEFLQRVQHG